MGLDATLRGHKGRVGQDDVGEFVPALLRGERVVFVDARSREAVQIEIHQRQAHHVRRNVVAREVAGEAAFFVGVNLLWPSASVLARRMCL